MATLFYRNVRLLLLTLVLLCVAGVASYITIPRLEDPESSVRVSYLFVNFPGADVKRVESLVAERIESHVREVDGIRSVDAMSYPGSCVVIVRLLDSIRDVEPVWSKIRDKLPDIEADLPAGASPPVFRSEESWGSYTLVLALAWDLETQPRMAILGRQAKELETKIRFVHGTRFTELYGAPEEQILVEVDPIELAARGWTPRFIADQIAQSDARIPKGTLRSESHDLLFEVTGEIDSLERLRRTPIHHATDEQLVTLGDIAAVSRTPRDPPSQICQVDDQRAVAVAARMETSLRIERWRQDMEHVLEEFRQTLPIGVRLSVLFDQAEYTEQRTVHLERSFLWGILFVILTVTLLLGIRALIPVCLGIPLTICIVLTGISILGISIDQMSIAGLILAIGMLIDNPIIVVDDVFRRLREGVPGEEAIRATVGSLFVPLTGSTTTTVLAFAPLMLMSGPTGEYLMNLSATVVLALVSSLFLALGPIPAVAVYTFDLFELRSQNRSSWLHDGISLGFLAQFYHRSLTSAVRWPLLGIFVSVILPCFGFLASFDLREQFFPAADRDHFHVQMWLDPGTAMKRTQTIVQRADAIIRENISDAETCWFLGANCPQIHYSMLIAQQNRPNFAQCIVQLQGTTNPRDLVKSLQETLNLALPSATCVVSLIEQGPPALAPIEYRLYGPDLEQLEALGEEARRVMTRIPGIVQTRATVQPAQSKLMFHGDEEAIRLAGHHNADIIRQLRGFLDGEVGGTLQEETESLPIRVRIDRRMRGDLASLESIRLLSSVQGSESPLALAVALPALGLVSSVPDTSSIPRRNGRRCNTIQGYAAAGSLPMELEAQFQRELEQSGFELPAGYDADFGGVSEERNAALGDLAAYFGVLLILMAAAVVLSFRSFRIAAIVAAVGVLAVGVGLLAVWLFNFPLGIMAVIGTMGMVGLAINDTIVVLAAIEQDAANGLSMPDQVADSVERSTRHVIATTLTTIAGFTPLVIGGGDFWPPMAIVIAAGVLGATLLALCFAPCCLVILRRVRRRKPA